MDGHELTYLQHIDEPSWQRIAQEVLDCERADILSRKAEEIFIGIGAGTRVFRVTGSSNTGHRGTRRWTVIIKVLSLEKLDFQSTSSDARSWDYWKREWHAYRSDWLHRHHGTLIAPRCFGSGEVRLGKSEGEMAWIAMTDLTSSQHRPWTLTSFRTVASHLGTFNGRYLDPAGQPADPWISRDWLRGWSEQAAPFINQLSSANAHSDAKRIFTADLVDDLIRTWDERESLHTALAELPQTFCHNDAFPRNVFLASPRGAQSAAIDWAFCGLAPIGQELSALVGVSQTFMEIPRRCWDDLEQSCLDGYLSGLQLSTGGRSADVRAGYVLSSALRLGIGSIPPLFALTMNPQHRNLVHRLFACPYETWIDHAAAVMRFQQRVMRRARTLIGS